MHQVLSDAPLHDVWCFRLRGGGPGVTVRDVMEVFVEIDGSRVDPAARVLFALRAIMGRLFGWDREVPTAPARSYVNRLSEEDRARSLDAPGSKRGFWTTVYTFDREALGEVINRTVHAFLLFALEPAPDGYTFVLGDLCQAGKSTHGVLHGANRPLSAAPDLSSAHSPI